MSFSEKNIKSLVTRAMNGEDTSLTPIFIEADAQFESAERKRDAFNRRSNPNLPPLTDEEMNKRQLAHRTKVAANLESTLAGAAKGDTQTMDLQQITGIASAASAVTSGGLLSKLGGIANLMAFAPIMDMVSGIMSWMAGKGYDAGVQESRFNRGIPEIAKKLVVNPDQLKAELTKPPAAAPAAPAAPAPQKPITIPAGTVALPPGQNVSNDNSGTLSPSPPPAKSEPVKPQGPAK